MPLTLPIEQSGRNVIVDVIRGFALVGVLIANFTSFYTQQLPPALIKSMSSTLDTALVNINSIFIEWKFMLLFSVLFGYGFGLILESLKKKNINPVPFFTRRMFWLFIFGCIQTAVWWGDVLHLYAISGIALLLFRKMSNGWILFFAILFAFILPTLMTYLFRNQFEFTLKDIERLYDQLRSGNFSGIVRGNLVYYYRLFVSSGTDLAYIIETSGRFLLGYYLLRLRLFDSVETKKALFKKAALISAPLMITYFIVCWLMIREIFQPNVFLISPFLSLGILAATCTYMSLLVIAYISYGMNPFFRVLQALGRMTLTNYLLVSIFLIVLLYGIGFGQMGNLTMRDHWMLAVVWLFVEIIFSIYWLKKFRYGPVEWIWRQLTYQKKLPLRK